MHNGSESTRVQICFVNESGEGVGSPIDLPINVQLQHIRRICNSIIEQDEDSPIAFFVKDTEITDTLEAALTEDQKNNSDELIQVIYQPQALFRVRAVTRCTSSLPGHSEPVISVNFSANGRGLASGSGDNTVRFWDLDTSTPLFTCKGHRNWVLVISWSPTGRKLASGCKNGEVCLWDPTNGKQMGRPLVGHKQFITALVWQPMHLNAEDRYLASSSKDTVIRIWDVILGTAIRSLTGHLHSVTCLRWGGSDLLYSGSQDRTIKVWRPKDGILCRTLEGHAHWINTLALNTDYILRLGVFDPSTPFVDNTENCTADEIQKKALVKYEEARQGQPERMVSGSDDFTMILWNPESDKKPQTRMTGHQQLINDVKFSPDSRIIASASFDKSIKLWDGKTGKFLGTLRGHVQAVYQIAWSADSRLLVSGSADSTVKLWSMSTKKLEVDLPGHADEVYAIDWAPNGQDVVSAGKDKVLKIWRM